MTIRRKGAAPWSVDYEAGLADAPVSSHPGVEADQVNPVIDAGFIDDKGNWQIDKVSNDRNFTFQDPNQALAAGAQISIEGINMLNHNVLILAVKDSSGNNILINYEYRNSITGVTSGPYNVSQFLDDGVNGAYAWHVNEYPGSAGGTTGDWDEILSTTNQRAATSWEFYKIIGVYGTVGEIILTNGEGANAGTISTAFLRIV